MYTQKAKTFMDKGDQLLQSAEVELFKAKEDVVPQMVCGCARNAIHNYLNSYLLKKGIENNEDVSLESLVQQCRNIDKKFNRLTLEDMHCEISKNDVEYCDNLARVTSCLQFGKDTKELILDKAWPRSKHVK